MKNKESHLPCITWFIRGNMFHHYLCVTCSANIPICETVLC